MSKPIDTVRCDRGRHILASLKADESGIFVEVREQKVYRDGFEPRVLTYRPADIEGFGGLGVTAVCACGHRYSVDLVSPLTTKRFTRAGRLIPDPPERQGGISSDRRKPVV